MLRDHRASGLAANGQARVPESVLLAFTRRGYTVRRGEHIGRAVWVVMAYRPRSLKDNGTYQYLVATIRQGSMEWSNGTLSINPGTADAEYRGRLS